MTLPPSYPPDTSPSLRPFLEYVLQVLTRRHKSVRVPYAAAITPDPRQGENVIVGVLTADITVNNPKGAREGMWLRFDFLQDGTGGWNVTWGSMFKENFTPDTSAGVRNTISFRFDGVSWVEMSEVSGL